MREVDIDKLMHSRVIKKCGDKAIQKQDLEILKFLDELQPHGGAVFKNRKP